MKITRQSLKQAKLGMEIIERTGRCVYIQMRNGDEKYIDFIVEKGNTYYCGKNENAYVYWDGATYGFTFSSDIFEVEEQTK